MLKQTSDSHNKIWTPGLLVTLIVVVALAILSIFTGAYDIMGQADGWQMVFITRLPRTLALLLSGSAMAGAGLVMQLLTQNRFADATTTGTAEWAGLGIIAAWAFIDSPSLITRMLFAAGFAFVGAMVFFSLLQRVKLKSSLIVPIFGTMLGAVVSAISTFLALQFNMSQTLETWFAASFAPVQVGRYEILWGIVAVTLIIYLFADRLTIVGLGKDIATNLGLNYQSILLIGTALVAIIVGLVSAVIGNLPFIGLIIPNIVSMVRGDDVKGNLAWVCLLGMAVITACDIISRTIIQPFEVPVSVILGSFGAFFFILVLFIQRKGGRP
ncbi:iron complex transport system permease protein [Aerococcus urinaehominis]|uniref:ABC transporter permease n=1 Tax=Aerococcus urinaehominis TaxID=128944 RepID=UPI000880E602|nr:iron chelate uptake ABC transporter family permease subunit [Aerococcus urinaehominis]SDL97902.1 iron complex transport system permease protein [Aerococcus urinaehominis]